MAALAFALALALAPSQAPGLTRNPFGVPVIRAASAAEAFELQGFAAAQDRWQQMDNSRRVARGRMAARYGKGSLASDREVLKLGYTDEELQKQISALSADSRKAIEAYTAGVNRHLKAVAGSQPWTELDTAAVFVQIARRFGQGGAGELRNLALLQYLKAQPNAKTQVLDIFDDLIWQNDPRATPTVSPSDDRVKERPSFPNPTRGITESHLAKLPQLGLMDLLPAIRLAERQDSALVAEKVGAPYKVGSYAVVVSGKRSATGWPILLSAPQMGHGKPSVIHEAAISCPDYEFAGIDIPGVPGIIIGANQNLAVALTSGVADTDDILYYESRKPGTYRFEGKDLPILSEPIEIPVMGEGPDRFVRERTIHGPIVLKTAKAVFVQRMSYWGKELQALDANYRSTKLTSADAIEDSMKGNPLSFNFFYATRQDIGYVYAGAVPVRPSNLDPRLPMPATKETVDLPMIPFDQMPKARNPRSGLLANWNNKPVSWWSNLDTPTWGRIFRNQVLLEQLTKPKLAVSDVELAAWSIARRNDTFASFQPYLPGTEGLEGVERQHADLLASFDGWKLAGHGAPALYEAWLAALRTELIAPTTGGFMTEATFRTVAQPTFLWNALQGKTKVNYLGRRTPDQVSRAALERAVNGKESSAWSFVPGRMNYGDSGHVPYSDRGTYIQIVEFGPVVKARNVAAPGVSEAGPHSADQIPLASSWTFKPMNLFPPKG